MEARTLDTDRRPWRKYARRPESNDGRGAEACAFRARYIVRGWQVRRRHKSPRIARDFPERTVLRKLVHFDQPSDHPFPTSSKSPSDWTRRASRESATLATHAPGNNPSELHV